MTIHELLALTGLTGSDEIPVWDAEASGEPTKKITAQNFAAAIKTLASLLGTGDVVNDLTNTATDKPGSANMLKTLNDKLSKLQLVKVDKLVTIPDGTQTEQTVTIDMSDVVPSGKVIHSISDARLNQYALPYISGYSGFTWVSSINDSSISIKSTTTAWNQYWLHVTLFIA